MPLQNCACTLGLLLTPCLGLICRIILARIPSEMNSSREFKHAKNQRKCHLNIWGVKENKFWVELSSKIFLKLHSQSTTFFCQVLVVNFPKLAVL